MATPPQQSPNTLVQSFLALPNARKLGVLAALAAVVALVVGAVLWSRAPEYRVLFSNLSERDAGAIITSLQQMNVPYRSGPGGAVLVPSDQVYDLRFKLASQGLPKGGAVGFELMDNPRLGMTQFQEQVTFQRALEGELARTIQSLAPVESARVHLAIPRPSVFVRDQQKPSASVLVNLAPGRSLEAAQVSAIAHLVSSSVPELPSANVTVVDQSGKLFTSRGNDAGAAGLNASQLDYLRDVEAYYARRVEAIVAPIVGEGNVRAEVRADLDFSANEFTSESYRPNPAPETQAIRSQQTVQESPAGGGGQAAGIPGAFSNQPPGGAAAPLTAPAGANAGVTAQAAGALAAGTAAGSRRENVTNFELDKTIRHVREPLGRIKRLSVGVLVNFRPNADPNGRPTPLPAAELEQINNLVREAVGYTQARGDTINVVNAAFNEPKVESVETSLWKDPDTVALAKEVLKNLLIFGLAFYLVFGVLRPLLRDLVRPAQTAVVHGESLDLGFEGLAQETAVTEQRQAETYQTNLGSVRDFARQNPRVVAEVVKEWIAKE